MGSQGMDRLPNYPGKPSGSAGGTGGGSDAEDRCSRAFSASLEEVERCSYFRKHGDVPPKGTNVSVRVDRRVSVIADDGEEIGYLPIHYNYLAQCMQDGYSYSGLVTSSIGSPVASVQVDIGPEAL